MSVSLRSCPNAAQGRTGDRAMCSATPSRGPITPQTGPAVKEPAEEGARVAYQPAPHGSPSGEKEPSVPSHLPVEISALRQERASS